MDLNYCTICYRETPGSELYCSETCRLHDTPEDMKTPLNATVPAPVSPTGDSGFAAAKRMGFRFRNYSGSSSDEEDENGSSGNGNEFVLPATRNVIFGNGAMAAQGTTGYGVRNQRSNYFANGGATRNHNVVQQNNNHNNNAKKGLYQHFAQLHLNNNLNLNNNNSNEEYLDSELAIFAALSKPTSLEHRNKIQEKEQRQLAKYVFKKEFPAAF